MRLSEIIGMTMCSVSDCDSKAHCRGWYSGSAWV